MTVQLSAGSDSPLPISWKAKVIEISLPCVAPISSMNSFLRSSSRISGTGSGAAVKSDLDALLDAGPAGSASASASKQSAATEVKPAARRSARLRGETVEDAEPTSNDAAAEGPAESDALKQSEDFAVGEDDDDHSTQNDEDADEHEHGEEGMPGLMGDDMLLDDDDDDDEMDMDDDMEGDGIVSVLAGQSQMRRSDLLLLLYLSTPVP